MISLERENEIRRLIDERFRERCALEKTEGGSDVEFDVRRRHSDELATTEDTGDTEVKTGLKKSRSSVSSVSSVVDRYQSTIASINQASVSRS